MVTEPAQVRPTRFWGQYAELRFVPRGDLRNPDGRAVACPHGFYFLVRELDRLRRHPNFNLLPVGDLALMAGKGEIDVETYEWAVVVDMEDRL